MNLKTLLVSGFALFAMFFGAGNLIFPPYLGITGGNNWWIGFICFFFVEVLSCVGIYAMIHGGGSIKAMNKSVGAVPGMILNTAAILCTGVLIAPPRTAATTYEMAILPLTDTISQFAFSVIFFLIVMALTIRPTQIVDIVGKFLTPVLIIGILLLIVVGIANPIGSIGTATSMHIARDGINAGYQAMDIISVAGFAIVIQDSLTTSGYNGWQEQKRHVAGSSYVAAFLLAVVYGGLTYLGATASTTFSPNIEQAELIVAITEKLMGKFGVVVLGIVVGFACLTTAIGLFGATAAYFARITNGKMPYKLNIVLLSIIGCAICNLGLTKIIELASPILSVVCPPFMTTVILLFFQDYIPRSGVYKGAALFATIASLFITIESYTNVFNFVTHMPLYNFGFAWLIPAVIGGIIGSLLSKPSQPKL